MRIRPIWMAQVLLLNAILCASCRQQDGVTTEVTDADTTEGDVVHSTPRISEYVGHETCAECHQEISAAHATTGHARTFALTSNSDIAMKLCGRTLSSSEPYGPYEYTCDELGVMVAIPERFADRAFPLEYALGSGDHAVTFFTLLPEPSGETVGIEHRFSWYHSDDSFDLTPGHDNSLPEVEAEFFGRVIRGDDMRRCIDCHTTTVEFDGYELSSLTPGVHCEECHGPGAAHVAAAEAGDAVDVLSSILRVATAQEEIALCGRCHRTAEDITTERLERYPKSVVRFQPVGLTQSRCFQQTPGGLRCTRCHDPHRPVDSRTIDDQIQTCLECHSEASQTHCPVSPDTDCISCHMPSLELVRGISFHDHWIRVRGDQDEDAALPDDADHATHP